MTIAKILVDTRMWENIKGWIVLNIVVVIMIYLLKKLVVKFTVIFV